MAKTKLITFDGFAGAGKTTQMRRIGKLLTPSTIPEQDSYSELCRHTERFCYEIKRQFVAPNRLDSIFVLDRLSSIKAAQSDEKQWRKDGFVIVDWFWNWIIHFGDREKERDAILSAFRTFLLADGGFEPISSFYLQIPRSESMRQRFIRDGGDPNLPFCARDGDKHRDKIVEQSTSWLSMVLPYFHVIDGRFPEEQITDTIMSKINAL